MAAVLVGYTEVHLSVQAAKALATMSRMQSPTDESKEQIACKEVKTIGSKNVCAEKIATGRIGVSGAYRHCGGKRQRRTQGKWGRGRGEEEEG